MKYILLLLVAALVGCKASTGTRDQHEGHNHGAGEIIFTPAQAEAAGLETETVEPATFNQIIRASGRVENPQGDEVVVAAASSGTVSLASALTEGAPVRKGQMIATVRNPEQGASAEYQAAERDYRRAESLIKDQIISQKEFNEAQRRYQSARTASTAASPLTGFIKNLLVGQGEYVAVGQAIATVATNNKLQLRAEVAEKYFGALPTITGANFELANELHHADKVLSYGRAVDGGYIPVLFEFPNAGGVVPGAYAEVWLLGAPVEDVISVPKTALSEEQGLYFVYVRLDEEGFQKREVALGADNGERVEILKGLHKGEEVVTKGTTQVRLAAMSGVIPEGHSHSH